jgi:heavy metal efflux system protein
MVITTLVAAIDLSQAANSNGIGSKSQKSIAMVVIGGLVASIVRTLPILPISYSIVHLLIHNRKNRKLLKKIVLDQSKDKCPALVELLSYYEVFVRTI